MFTSDKCRIFLDRELASRDKDARSRKQEHPDSAAVFSTYMPTYLYRLYHSHTENRWLLIKPHRS
jgi:hypothetical protein